MTWLPEPFGHAPITCAPARAHASVLRIYQCAHCHDRHSELFLLTASQWPPHMEHSPVSPQASSTRQSPPSQCKDSQKKFPTMPSSHVPGQQQRSRRVNPINRTLTKVCWGSKKKELRLVNPSQRTQVRGAAITVCEPSRVDAVAMAVPHLRHAEHPRARVERRVRNHLAAAGRRGHGRCGWSRRHRLGRNRRAGVA